MPVNAWNYQTLDARAWRGEGWSGDFFANHYGTRLKRVFDAHGTELDGLACDYGGEGMLFLQFAAPRYASHAARLNTGLPVCQTKTAIFNGAQDHLLDYCSRLGGEMVGNS